LPFRPEEWGTVPLSPKSRGTGTLVPRNYYAYASADVAVIEYVTFANPLRLSVTTNEVYRWSLCATGQSVSRNESRQPKRLRYSDVSAGRTGPRANIRLPLIDARLTDCGVAYETSVNTRSGGGIGGQGRHVPSTMSMGYILLLSSAPKNKTPNDI